MNTNEFVYEEKRHKPTLVCDGVYKNYYYAITSLGTHPCAYVEIPENNMLYGIDFEDIDHEEIDCHCGFSYSAYGLPCGIKENKWFIGWDYGHWCDYMPIHYLTDGHKWTTTEIKNEIKDVIEQIIEYNKGE